MRTVLLTALLSTSTAAGVGPGGVEAPAVLGAEHAYTGANDPVHMLVRVSGTPVTGWTLLVGGKVGADAPSATLELLLEEGVATALPGSMWTRALDLKAGDEYAETFLVGPTPLGASLMARFSYEGEWYDLLMRYAVDLPESGSTAIVLQPLLVEGGDPDALLPDYPGSVLPEATLARETPHPSKEDVTAQALTTISGTLQFNSPTGATYLCRLCYIDVWDDDVGDGDDYLGATVTTFSGTYSMQVDNTDCFLCSGVDVYFVAWTYTNAGLVVKANTDTYWFTTPVLKNNCPDTTCSIGTSTMATSGDDARGFFGYYALALGWNEVRNGGPNVDIGPARMRVPVSDPNAAYTDVFYNDIEIGIGSNMATLDAMSHEHGHYALQKRWNPDGTNDIVPPATLCTVGTHYMTTSSDAMCAWIEGWAHYFAMETQDDSSISYPGGSTFNLELRPCASGCGWASGDTVEGRVASALWDLVDNAVDSGSTENVDRSLPTLWPPLMNTAGTEAPAAFLTYYQFWTAHSNSGSEFRTAANWNTIPYT